MALAMRIVSAMHIVSAYRLILSQPCMITGSGGAEGEVITYGSLLANHFTVSLDDLMFRDVKVSGFW